MTPKEKAGELATKYWVYFTTEETVNSIFRHSKQCALIAVDEIIEVVDHTPLADRDYEEHLINYWQEVKQEIEKL